MWCSRILQVISCATFFSVAQFCFAQPNSEAQLAKTFEALKNNRLDVALNEVNDLLRVNPNFKLAQMVKGDLLMAYAGQIKPFGNVNHAPREKIDELREEAKARLQRILTQEERKNLPRYLWQLDSKQKYVLVADASRSTLYVYENVNGEPNYVADYYVTIGKLGTDKAVEGDQRTPIGVYYVTSRMPKEKLADMYGNGAFPLSYPNEWDLRQGRTGQGIWIHGTPSDTYSRPPRASNGCLVLSNDDLDDLAKYLQVGVTPVIITSHIDWISTKDQDERNELLGTIEKWRKDWSSLNTDLYLSHYSPDFVGHKMNFATWVKQKRQINAEKSWIKVSISDLSVFTYPDQPNMAVVTFEQDYRSSNISNRTSKRQYWQKQNKRWRIIYEGAS